MTIDLHLNGKVALVTGASEGIGRAVAARLAALGMRVVAIARNPARWGELAQEIGAAGGECLAHPADLRQRSAAEVAVAAAIARFGRLDLLVNNAGATARGDFFSLTDDQWEDGYALKLFGAMRLCRAAWPHLAQQSGSIVNIAGIGGKNATADFAIGGSVNAAVMYLTKSLADRGVKDDVRVNAINPGYIRTARLTKRLTQAAAEKKITVDEAGAAMTEANGIARFGEPGEIADMVAFLASGATGYVQGAIIDVDGGRNRGM